MGIYWEQCLAEGLYRLVEWKWGDRLAHWYERSDCSGVSHVVESLLINYPCRRIETSVERRYPTDHGV